MAATNTVDPHRRLAVSYLLMLAAPLAIAANLLHHSSVLPSLFGAYSMRLAGAMMTIAAVGALLPLILPNRFYGLLGRLGWGIVRPTAMAELVLTLATISAFILPLISARWWPFAETWRFAIGLLLGTAGLALFFRGVASPERFRTLLTNAALMTTGIGLTLITLELGLRLAGPIPYRILPPSVRREFHVAPEAMPGIEGPSIYSTDRNGIRGDPYDPEHYNLLAVGGSTTECLYLDDAETWPYLLQEELPETASGQPVWVGNVGRSGHTSADHVYALRYFVPQYRVDAVMVLVGFNDMLLQLRQPGYTLPDPTDSPPNLALMRHTFILRPPATNAFPTQMELWNVFDLAVSGVELLARSDVNLVEDTAGLNYVRRREMFQSITEEVSEPPDLAVALGQYRRNLIALAGEASRQGVRLILITQPIMQNANLSEKGQQMLWMAVLGQRDNPQGRYSVEAVSEAMHLFNEQVLDVCDTYEVECVDLAGYMSGNEAYFYDDAHFNEAGAHAVAWYLADYLRHTPPFAEE